MFLENIFYYFKCCYNECSIFETNAAFLFIRHNVYYIYWSAQSKNLKEKCISLAVIKPASSFVVKSTV